MAFRHIRFFLISVDRHLAKVSAHILYTKLRHPRLYQAEFFFIYEEFDLYRSLAISTIRHTNHQLLYCQIKRQIADVLDSFSINQHVQHFDRVFSTGSFYCFYQLI